MYLSGETFLKNGCPPYPPSKDFNTNYSLIGINLSGCNFNIEVLGKEFEEEPFFKRVFLNDACKFL